MDFLDRYDGLKAFPTHPASQTSKRVGEISKVRYMTYWNWKVAIRSAFSDRTSNKSMERFTLTNEHTS
jgi:hypothetical protein